MYRALFFIGSGLIFGAIVAMVVGPPGAGGMILSAGIFSCMLGLFSFVAVTLSSMRKPNPALARAAQAAGRTGLARIDHLKQTNMFVNEAPLCQLEVTVQPRNAPAYRTVIRKVIPLMQLHEFRARSVHPVVILAENEPDIEFRPHGKALERNLRVPPISSVQVLRIPPKGRLKASGKRRRSLSSSGPQSRPVRWLVFGGLALLAASSVIYFYRDSVALSLASMRSEGQLHADMRSPQYLENALEEIQSETGSTRLHNVMVYEDYLVVSAALESTGLKTDEWIYRRGVVTHRGASLNQPKSEKEYFGADEVAWDKLWPAVVQAGKEVNASSLEDTILSVGHHPVLDLDSEYFMKPSESVTIEFIIGDDYGSTNFTMDAQGKNLSSN